MARPEDRLFDLLSEPRVRRQPVQQTVAAMKRLWRRSSRDPEALARAHDRLLFLAAHPPSLAVRRTAERLLSETAVAVRRLEARGADLGVFDEPEVAGVEATTIATDFSYDLARWLVAREAGRVAIDWRALEATDRMRATWPAFLPLLEEEALADANVPYTDWLDAAAGKDAGDPRWLLARYASLPLGDGEPSERWDSLGVPISWTIPGPASRTRMRLPGPPLFLHDRPLLARRDVSLAETFAAPPLRIRRLSRRDGGRLCDLVRTATAARYREFYTFTYADPGSVLAARPGRGVELFLMGVRPDRRLPLRAAYGGFVVKNGVPIGYIEGLAFLERLEIGFNLYYAFREGESAWIYAQVLKFHRDALGVTSFSVDPYQLGFGNAEAIASGAFWFYRKLGFRPTDPDVARRVAREEDRIRADPAYRSSEAVLRGLVTHNLLYEVPGSRAGDWDRFHIRRIGLAVNRRMRREFGGDADRMRAAAERRVGRVLNIAPDALSVLERRAFSDLALVLDLVPDLARWSRGERAGVARIVRAKARGTERHSLALSQRHTRFREALLRLGSSGAGRR